MDHMEFSIALPQYVEFTSTGAEWTNMKQRLNAHLNHSSDSYHHHIQGLVKAFLISIAGEQVQEVFSLFGLSYDEVVKFSHVLQLIEDVCLPRFLIIYNRYKFFTSRQGFGDTFDDFLRDLLSWSDNCEFGDLKDILIKDCILTGISDNSVRQNLLKTEELDLTKTLDICRAVEQARLMKHVQISTDQLPLCDAYVGTVNVEDYGLKVAENQNALKQLSDACTNVTDHEITIVSVEKGQKNEFSTATIGSGQEESIVNNNKYSHPIIDHKAHSKDSNLHFGTLIHTERIKEKCQLSNLQKNGEMDIIDTVAKEEETNSPVMPRKSKRHKKPLKTEIKQFQKSLLDHSQPKKNLKENQLDVRQKISLKAKKRKLFSGTRSMKVGVRKNELLCSSCGQSFLDEKSILSHYLEVHSKTQMRRHSLKCMVCKLVFMDLVTLRKHRLTHKGEKKFKCEMCSAMFGNPSHLKVHLRLHTGERPFTCDTCGASFPESSKLKAHIRKHTGEKPYHCSICNRTFAWTAAYTRHLRTHTGERPYTCEFCGGNFADFTSLQRHRRIHTKEKPYKCDMCEAQFTDPSGLKLHKRTHTGERPFSCETCGTSFARSQHLKEHVKLHTGEKPFECETCGAKFVEASKLKSHRRKHTGEKPYLCKICGTSFAWTAAYTRHMRTHTLEKPYVCDFCGSHYADHSTLTRHRRTHTGERPYPCKICSTNFADNSSLHRHMRIHTGEKSYTCEVCGSSFAVKSYLIRHMRIHTGEKPYGCHTCGSKFTDSSKLNRHRKIHEKGRVRRAKQLKCEEQQQEQYEHLQPLQHLLDEDDISSQQPLRGADLPNHQVDPHHSLTLVSDMQHPLLATSNLLPLTNVLSFNPSIIT